MSTSGGSGSGGLSTATVHLTAAQIGTLFSAPVELIAAPGASRVVDVIAIAYESVAGTSGWDTDHAGLYYEGDVSSSEWIDDQAITLDMLNGSSPEDQIVTVAGNPNRAWDVVTVADTAVVVAQITGNAVRSAPIATTSIDDPGAGYAAGDTGTIDDATFGTDTGYVVDTVGALGIVTSMHLALSTAGYDPTGSPYDTTAGGAQAGVGTGLKVNVLTIAAATGSLYVTAFYQTITTH